MENVVRNLGDTPLQPEANYISCLNTVPQYKASSRNFQMNNAEETVNRTTNCKINENVSAVPSPALEESSWTSKSRDWSEEVERVAADAENDLNSSPQHQALAESAKLNDIKRKHTLRSPQNVYNDVAKFTGIGRGKNKTKSLHLQGNDYDKRIPDGSMLCSNVETNSDVLSMQQVQTAIAENSSSCNSPENICGSDGLKEGTRKQPLLQSDADVVPVQAQLNGAFCVQGDMRGRNMPIPNVDHFREYDYKRFPNGIDTFNRGFRHKNFRMNRVPNNNSNPLQYNKGFDSRNFGHRYQPIQPNVKQYRPVKPHESHYRHHDNRRNQQQLQSSRAPFPIPLDKMVYAKHKGIYGEREFSVYDANRNFASQNFSIQNEINRQMSGSVSYVPQTNVAAFRSKHNAPRIVSSDKMMCNKNELPGNVKAWPVGGVCTDSTTSTVTCHNRTVVTPVKSVVSQHCATCTSHPHEKHCPSLKEEGIHNQKRDVPEKFKPDHSQAHSLGVDKMDSSVKINNSQEYALHNSRIPHNDSYNAMSNSERLPGVDHSNSSYEYLQSNDVELKNHSLERTRSSDGKDSYLREKLGFTPAHLRKDLHSEKNDASPKVNPGNVPLPKQSSGEFCNADNTQNNLMFLSDSHYSASSVPHSSYADAIRVPANTIGKVTSCQMSNCVEVAVPKNEYQDSTREKVHPKLEADHPNASSEWIRSRLSQIDINNANHANGMNHQVASSSHQGVNPRPIAVSLEKPSFYNSKIGAGVHVQPPNLSSPERRMLECQYVEEQLSSNALGYKKAGEKLSFPSELTSAGEHSSSYMPVNVRTDSTLSDTSSVCSSMSGTFKGEGHCQMLKASTPPVIIMNNCASSEGMTEISFGIEMDEIMKLCGDSDIESIGDSPMTLPSDSGFCSTKMPDLGSCDAEALEDEEIVDPPSITPSEENVGEYLVIGNKRLLWRDRVNTSNCNLLQIVDFLQESVGDITDGGIFYVEE